MDIPKQKLAKYSTNSNSSKKDVSLRNDIHFPNMLVNPNNYYDLRPFSNVYYFNQNFLNKKRTNPQINEKIHSSNKNITHNNTQNTLNSNIKDSNSKSKYL